MKPPHRVMSVLLLSCSFVKVSSLPWAINGRGANTRKLPFQFPEESSLPEVGFTNEVANGSFPLYPVDSRGRVLGQGSVATKRIISGRNFHPIEEVTKSTINFLQAEPSSNLSAHSLGITENIANVTKCKMLSVPQPRIFETELRVVSLYVTSTIFLIAVCYVYRPHCVHRNSVGVNSRYRDVGAADVWLDPDLLPPRPRKVLMFIEYSQ
eukprot:TRINITY_DN13749_c0_g1_i1.p1 TRINITY_DN13749_c0_g1~~TRINITY_DN13749_c0_g1_i1.p1  ORF type:complete len:228 (+),score=15.37 TRINITY_DN13749_c0_g1_i1:56-685(+)